MPDYSVIVRKGEIFVKRWNTDIRAYEEKKKTEQVLSDVLQFPLVLEETTFGQFFALIAKEKDFYQKVFNAALYGHPLEPFIKECELPPKKSEEMDYVEVEWCCQEFEGEFEFWPAFNGWGTWPHDFPGSEEMPDGEKKGGIAIEFTPLNEYNYLPLKLNMDSSIYSLSKCEPLAKGTRKFTVYDVIKAILFEITWAGDISEGRTKKCHGDDCEKTSEAA